MSCELGLPNKLGPVRNLGMTNVQVRGRQNHAFRTRAIVDQLMIERFNGHARPRRIKVGNIQVKIPGKNSPVWAYVYSTGRSARIHCKWHICRRVLGSLLQVKGQDCGKPVKHQTSEEDPRRRYDDRSALMCLVSCSMLKDGHCYFCRLNLPTSSPCRSPPSRSAPGSDLAPDALSWPASVAEELLLQEEQNGEIRGKRIPRQHLSGW